MKFINNFTATANQFLAVALLKKLVIKWKQQLGNLWSTCRDNFLKKKNPTMPVVQIFLFPANTDFKF